MLAKNKSETKTQFINVSGEDFFEKKTNNNVLLDEHIERIMELFDNKASVDHLSKMVDNSLIAANDYNLSVSSYVEGKDNRDLVNIALLNTEIIKTVEKINSLRADIDDIIKDIEA